MATIFKIPVTWIVSTTINVEAKSLEDACEKADSGKIPIPWTTMLKRQIQPITGTMEVDYDEVEELNPSFAFEG